MPFLASEGRETLSLDEQDAIQAAAEGEILDITTDMDDGPDVEIQGTQILTDGDRLFKRLQGQSYQKYKHLLNVNPTLRYPDRVRAYQLASSASTNSALLVQSRGHLMHEPCDACQKGRGPFVDCKAGFAEINSGACGCCIWAHTGSLCSLYRGTRGPRGSRTKDAETTSSNGPSTIDVLAGTVPEDDGYYRSGTPDSLLGSQTGSLKRKRDAGLHPQLQSELEAAADLATSKSRNNGQASWVQSTASPKLYSEYGSSPIQPRAVPPPKRQIFDGTFFIHPMPESNQLGALPRNAGTCRTASSFFGVVMKAREQQDDAPIHNGASAVPFAAMISWPDAPRRIMIPWYDENTFDHAMRYINRLNLDAIDVRCHYKETQRNILGRPSTASATASAEEVIDQHRNSSAEILRHYKNGATNK